MYLKEDGYVKYTIKGLYDVWLPQPPARHLIQGSDLKKSDQIWRRTPLPEFYLERRAEEEEKQEEERQLVIAGEMPQVKHFDPYLEKYRREEWRRRICGHHFMNNGKVVYITGAHYSYLQWCKLDSPENDGYPTFYMPQVDRFYFRQLCWEDPFCLGYFIVGPRGFGKSTEEVWCQLENITRAPAKRFAAIQSKNKDDAEALFTEKMVPMFNELPHFFKPEYNHGTNPVKGFTFSRERGKGERSKKAKFGSQFELGSTVRHFPAKEKALDGKTLADVIQDEIGKLHPNEEANAIERLNVVIRAVYRNDRKIGIIRGTSTIEHMKEGGTEAKFIWDSSNPVAAERDANGYTKSKLYKFFVSGVETKVKFADKHGYIDQEKAVTAIMADRAAVEDDPLELTSRMRKEPLTEEDAFIKDQNDCPFPVLIINNTLTKLSYLKESQLGRRGNLEYINGKIDTDVIFRDDPSGLFTIYHMPDQMRGSRKVLNNMRYEFNGDKKLWLPGNDDLFTGGVDPIRWRRTKDTRASMMAGYGIWRYDPLYDSSDKDVDEWLSHSIMWKYHGRSLDPNDDYENIIKAIRYFGHRIMPEGNVSDFTKHLYDRGYWKCVISRKDFDASVLAGKSKNPISKENAVDTTSEVVDSYVKRIIRFLKVHGSRIKDKALLKQMLDFDPNNATPFDLIVAFGYALISMDHRPNYEYMPQDVSDYVETYFPTYDISGTIAKPADVDDDEDEDQDYDMDLAREIARATGYLQAA